jgi:formylglycine-generating enzyme required for sulfatase activity
MFSRHETASSTHRIAEKARSIAIILATAGVTFFVGSKVTFEEPPPESLRCNAVPSKKCFVYIPAGTFWFGAQATDPEQPGYDPDALPNEGPPRKVHMEGYWIQKREQTWDTIEECIQAGACPKAKSALNKLISWDDANEVCTWLGGRLPTELEWEYAGRGPESYRYPWGDQDVCGLPASPQNHTLDPKGWLALPDCRARKSGAWPMQASPFSVETQSWGAAEWVADSDPANPAHKMQRGGTVDAMTPDELRLAARWSAPATARLQNVAFRCAW